jgi:hypothetical protein
MSWHVTTMVREKEPRLNHVFYTVEANSFERLKLWEEDHEKLQWEDSCTGFVPCIKVVTIDGTKRPIVVEIYFAKLLGKMVAFYNACSQVVDHDAVEQWLHQHISTYKDNHCDAMNWHLCVHTLEDALEKK